MGRRKRKKRSLGVVFETSNLACRLRSAEQTRPTDGASNSTKKAFSLSLSLNASLFSSFLASFLSFSSFRPPSKKKKQIPPPRRSRRSGAALRLVRLGGMFALGGVLAASKSAVAGSAPPGVKGLFADPELAHRDADYAHFAELLGTVMLVCEGGKKKILGFAYSFFSSSSKGRGRKKPREGKQN